ncbi:class I SAM-dependent methyltransferase [Sphingomonas baiyangensis]|uniref:class I SAM-dependent methyltransferase n=1 Tax=Sphingomonas baiyangensis TaxID=2572576 RepID=UPI0020167B06|nr:methyltransferase domain-containing protein [Sphingomonas baiyangensis]
MSDSHEEDKVGEQNYTPPLGTGDTQDYDRAIRIWTRERRWRSALLQATAPVAGETIIDFGCGTGTFAVMLKTAQPDVRVIGIDPDEEALTIARAKAEQAGVDVEWRRGFASDLAGDSADAAVSSLVFHQMPVVEKARAFAALLQVLRPRGRLLVADYGRQRGLMRLLFRATIQRLDGVADTQPNADGILPDLISEAGFVDVREIDRVHTVTGTIMLLEAKRPA